jgi:hypothetical protein
MLPAYMMQMVNDMGTDMLMDVRNSLPEITPYLYCAGCECMTCVSMRVYERERERERE